MRRQYMGETACITLIEPITKMDNAPLPIHLRALLVHTLIVPGVLVNKSKLKFFISWTSKSMVNLNYGATTQHMTM